MKLPREVEPHNVQPVEVDPEGQRVGEIALGQERLEGFDMLW